MKLKRNIDLSGFLRAVQGCEGEVFFFSSEGDELNLKSLLSQYMFLAAERDKKLLTNGSIVCNKESDQGFLSEYIRSET